MQRLCYKIAGGAGAAAEPAARRCVRRIAYSYARAMSASPEPPQTKRARTAAQAAATAVGAAGGRGPPKVLVVAGPTGVGKSKLAEALCHSLPEGGEIISADSVQVYRSLNIGSAKPTEAEQKGTRHHLIDIAEPSAEEGYTAGQFCRDAAAAITDVWSRGKVPVVVGGTMMYHQWLVHGQPDAPPSDPAVAAAIDAELAPFREKGDWEAALELLVSAGFSERAEKLSKNDWYRLARALEIGRAAGGSGAQGAFTGARERRGSAAEFDFRCFFLVGERSRICQKIDRRCESMLGSGLLQEVAELLRTGVLVPRTTAGKSIGYRQTVQYLLAAPQQDAAAATDDDAAAEQRFRAFLGGFCTVSRQYSTEQMKWFRKDKTYLWVRSELEKPDPIADAMERITRHYRADRASFEAALGGGEDCAEHERVVMLNKQEAKAMRHYTPSASCLLTPAQDTDGAGAALRARLVAQGEEIRAALRKDKENGDLPPSAALPEQQPS